MSMCDAVPCGAQPHARGMCQRHYQQWKKWGNPWHMARNRFGASRCRVDGCDADPKTAGYCSRHYQRLQKYGDPLNHGAAMREKRDNEKWCPACRSWLSMGSFANNRKEKSGLDAYCKQCKSDKRLLMQYGLTRSQWNQLLDSQGGGCAICHRDEPGGQGTWHVDHDHDCCAGTKSCGECVRALLCSRCNHMIGMAEDNPEILLSGAAYLMTHSRIPTTTGGK